MLSFVEDCELKKKLKDALTASLCQEVAHATVIDLSSNEPRYAGYDDSVLVHPASLSKLYVALGFLHEAKKERVTFEQKVRVKALNVAPEPEGEQVFTDSVPPLKAGQEVLAGYLLDLMLTVSENTAANELIDLVTRPRINKLVQQRGWEGSEVTRKFISRELEPLEYRAAHYTRSSALHLAEFFYLLDQGKLLGPDLDAFLKLILWNQRDKTKIGGGLPPNLDFAHKTGWFSAGPPIGNISGDCGIVEGKGYHYVVSCIVRKSKEEGQRMLQRFGHELHSRM